VLERVETYSKRKRDLLEEEKRSTRRGKETYSKRKKDLLEEEKRPTRRGKESYSKRKRVLLELSPACAAYVPAMHVEHDVAPELSTLDKCQKRPTRRGKETYSRRVKETY
jgi:hypothetical protein